jgi:hypothetical protein
VPAWLASSLDDLLEFRQVGLRLAGDRSAHQRQQKP